MEFTKDKVYDRLLATILLGKMSNFSFYTFHSLGYISEVFSSVCRGFGLLFCCGFFVWDFVVGWGFFDAWVYLYFEFGGFVYVLGVLLWVLMSLVLVYLGFFFYLVGFNFWFLNTLCLVPPNEAWGVNFENFFWFNDFHQLKDMWKVPGNWKYLNWSDHALWILLRACLLLMQLWATPFFNGEGFHVNLS